MTIIRTVNSSNVNGFDYKIVYYKNNNDDDAFVVYRRVTGTTTWYSVVDQVPGEVDGL